MNGQIVDRSLFVPFGTLGQKFSIGSVKIRKQRVWQSCQAIPFGRGIKMKNANGHKFNVYHRSEVTGRICRHTVSALDWETAQYIRDHWNRRNPNHRKGGAWIDYHDLHLMPIAADAGAGSLPYHPFPASTSVGFSEYE